MWSSLELLTGLVWGWLATSLCQVNRSLTSPVAALRAVLFAVSSSLVWWVLDKGGEKFKVVTLTFLPSVGCCGLHERKSLPLWSTHWRLAAAPCRAAVVTVGGAVLPSGGYFLSPRCRLRGARSPLQTQPLMPPPRCHRIISAKMQCAWFHNHGGIRALKSPAWVRGPVRLIGLWRPHHSAARQKTGICSTLP